MTDIRSSNVPIPSGQTQVRYIGRDHPIRVIQPGTTRTRSAMVREYGSSPEATRPYGRSQGTTRPHPTIPADVMDGEGNLRAADIGITWEGNETFLHGVKVVGPQFSRPAGPGPIMSTPYPPGDDEDRRNWSMTAQPSTPSTPVTDGHVHRPSPEVRQGYRRAAPIQRFNNRSLNWPAWFRHFRAVTDVHGWSKDQRALQLVSYLDETAMNVAQELGDNDIDNYDVLVKLSSDRFDPASRVSAFRSRFHGRSRRQNEDADTFADALSELCRVGYPQSPPEMRQELIAKQFVRGQSDPELKKYLWVVIRTQKDRKLHTLIEVCTDFASLMATSHLHRPVEQTFAVHREVESYPEDEGELDDIFAVGDCPPWNNRRPPEPSTTPTLQQMFALARRMGYDRQTAIDQTQVTVRSRTRVVGSALRHVPVGTTPESSVSVVASLDTCEHVAHSRTHPYRSDLWAGNFSPTIVNNGTAIIYRETLHRPGPHPHRSTFTSFKPHAIIMHQTNFISLTAGYFN